MFLLPIPKGSSTPASPRAAPYHLWLPSSHFHTLNDLRKGWKQHPVLLRMMRSHRLALCRRNRNWRGQERLADRTESKENGKPPREDQKTSFKAKWALGWAALRSRMEEKLFFLDPGFLSIALLPVLREECCEQEQHFPDPWPSSWSVQCSLTTRTKSKHTQAYLFALKKKNQTMQSAFLRQKCL